MKTITRSFLALLFLSPVALSADPKPDRPETKIESAMDKMAGAFRKLRRQASDAAQNTSSLELLAQIKAGATESLKHIPLRAAQVPESERKAWVANYQKKMEEFIGLVARAEAAFKEGNNSAAERLVNQLADAQKAGHKDYKQPDAPKKK